MTADLPRPPRAPGGTRWRRWIFALAGAALAALAVPAVVALLPGRGAAERPCVILISIDSLRADHLGCYGYFRDTSPVLDALAREGARFETVVSSTSWTLPAHAALFTSLPDRVHGCFDASLWLDGSRTTVAEVFRDAGYATAGFYSGPFLHPVFGLSQGFASYEDCTSYPRQMIEMLEGDRSAAALGDLSHEDVTNEIVLASVDRWLDEHRGGPFFLFVHLWDVHFHYIPPPPFDTLFDPDYDGPVDGIFDVKVLERPPDWTDRDVAHFVALYDGEIRWTDHCLGKLFESLRRRGLFDGTVIAVTADHGEAFFEHGVRGHRHSLYEEEIRIPLLLRHPPSIRAGLSVTRPAHLIDIAPTLLALAGVGALPEAMGRDLTPLLADPRAEWVDTPAVAELLELEGRHLSALRYPGFKLIKNLSTGEREVFDLVQDPGEQAALTEAAYPLSPAALEAAYKDAARAMEATFRRLPVPRTRDTPAIPAMTEAHLRSLGYLR
ncbi:MAG: sulfatase [Planctomycetes bacterium]|nr:sulfatase [Planctomycetota bacterium]